MNIGAIIPPPNIVVNKPVKISPKGNVYKIQIAHKNPNDDKMNNFEVWATKEAVQKHFAGFGEPTGEYPKEYELKKFAKQMYEKQLRSNNGRFQHKGMFVTTDNITHGDPRLWPTVIAHPEVKM